MKYSPCPKCRSRGNDSRGDNLVSFKDGGSKCFACGYYIPGGNQFLTKRMNENTNYKTSTVLPHDFTEDIPASALKWLLQYGLSHQHWKNQIGYSPTERRLVFKVGSPTIFSIGRYVGDEPDKRKWYVWGDPSKHCEVVMPGGPVYDSTPAVLVEDLVSAHKVADAGYIAVPLFGTALHNCHKFYLMQANREIVLWLDYDQGGSIARKAMSLQSLVDNPVRTIKTIDDPKKLSTQEIQEILG